MSQKTFTALAGLLFFVIALLHLARILAGWDAVVDGIAIPLWVSLLGLIVASSLAYSGLRLSGFAPSLKKPKRRH